MPEPPARRSDPAIPPSPTEADTVRVRPAADPVVPSPRESPELEEPRADRAPPGRARRWAAGVAFVLVAVAVGLVLGTRHPVPTAAAPEPPVFRPGVHVVGDGPWQMPAGVYATSGPTGAATSCSYVRLLGFDGSAGAVAGQRTVAGPASMHLRPGDAGVVLEGPCDWAPRPPVG
ncbi:hypothetical protein [Actinomycetospora sp. NBRC 106375]|uniref:hypothetical protein n=1 Tax=Actinomycetospora sp. NBRC 106375 TaxID=3032207 RepID=UPI0025524AB6|nr:hypothetical protein [Actinomycetospora sp. NBRC 106375]